jgi:2-polyprenyl-6-hydroxyphenyl methylase/3-demethylubiquinone-9 3-methyltransferase
MTDETGLSTHYRFGENWAAFAEGLTERHVANAVRDLERLTGIEAISGKRFLDAGSGSGLSALAALRLGAAEVVAFDLDPHSVATSRAVLGRFAPGGPWSVREMSVFDLDPAVLGRFDVVHSWGVLHHTGDMWRALEACLPLVVDDGLLAVALYRKTPLCGLWQAEKALYSRAPAWLRAPLRWAYKAVYVAGLLATGRNPVTYTRDYAQNRGMSWARDVDDWLGGYPYCSVTPDELEEFFAARGFVCERIFAKPARLAGLLGSHCDEFVFRPATPDS